MQRKLMDWMINQNKLSGIKPVVIKKMGNIEQIKKA